jgi:hypothetical protein
MVQTLQTNLLSQSVGYSVKNHKGEPLGEIAEVIHYNNKHIEYLILRSSILFGKKDRFFAIPASTTLIKITRGGEIILQTEKNELQQAKGINFDQCPRPNFQFEPSIFEIYQYQKPAVRTDSITSPAPKKRTKT